MSDVANNVEQYEYKTEMKQLLDIIIHSLYTHKEVFLRELISNASDALNKVRVLKLGEQDIVSPDAALRIDIETDKDAKKIIVKDTGIGMTKEELISNIGTIAASGTLAFLKDKVAESGDLKNELIGKFGVGFYSSFMVSDRVEIETKSALKGSNAYRWSSDGSGSYTIEEIEKKERGTSVICHIKSGEEKFLDESYIEDIIKKYSNFADFPIFINGKRVNKISAVWRKNTSDLKDEELNEFYKFIANDYENPLGHLHLSIEGAVVNFKALLFIPAHMPFDILNKFEPKGLHLYSNKILIRRDCKDLLPEYLGFVRGVVDTIDLPLNVSRELTQSSPLIKKIENILTSKILALLSDWANTGREKYEKFYKNFGRFLSIGIDRDSKNRDKIIEMLRYEIFPKDKGKLYSLEEYISFMKAGQNEIYYLAGDDRSSLEGNPKLEYFKKNNIPVILLYDPVDIFTVSSLNEYKGKKIISVEKAGMDIFKDKGKSENKLEREIVELFKSVLKDEVEDVKASVRLVDSPATLVSPDSAMDIQMEKMMNLMHRTNISSKRILEINLDNPLIRNISKLYIANKANPIIEKCVKQIFEGAKLLDGEYVDVSSYVKRMTEIMSEATK